MQLTKNFNIYEFTCKDGTLVPKNLINNAQELAENLQVIRDYIDSELTLVSAFRTDSWNKKVGGAKNSEHKKAKAADLISKFLTPKQLHFIILKLIRIGKIKDGGLSLYPSFVHYDIGKSRRWYYNNK